MPIESAAPDQLAGIQRLTSSGRHTFINFGHEDLAELVGKGGVVVGTEGGDLWGLLCLRQEERPDTLPEDAPDRIDLNGMVLVRGRSPIRDIPALTEAAIDRLAPTLSGYQIIVYANRSWVIRPLIEAHFTIVQRIQFFRLEKLSRYVPDPIPTPAVEICSATLDHLSDLAWLDAATFEPIWHFSRRNLATLLLTNRLRFAKMDGRIVGYAALALDATGNAQLTRLAVCPRVQGLGIGRQLLADAIVYARDARADALLLNTQVDNLGAQHLYKSFGFRSTGDNIPVMTREIRPDWLP